VNTLVTLGILAVLFLALPWLAIAFKRYCDVVNRFASRRTRSAQGIPYTPPAREHCGHPSPETGLTSPRTECVLHPGHTGSHADEVGCRWWPITDQEQPRV